MEKKIENGIVPADELNIAKLVNEWLKLQEVKNRTDRVITEVELRLRDYVSKAGTGVICDKVLSYERTSSAKLAPVAEKDKDAMNRLLDALRGESQYIKTVLNTDLVIENEKALRKTLKKVGVKVVQGDTKVYFKSKN